MTLGLVLSLVTSALIGLLTLGCVWWRPTGLRRSRLLASVLAVGVGLGLSSSVFFAWRALVGARASRFPPLELALILLLGGVALYASRIRRSGAPRPGPEGATAATGTPPWLALTLGLCVACAAIAFLVQSATSPHGDWDAWMTWNMHARAIFRGGDHWREVLTGLPVWSHPDYPLLVPGSVARIWAYAGGETALAPASVAMLFTFATVGLLYSGVSVIRSPTQGALAALLLLGTKFFILHGASQYADIPLSFFFLATLVLLTLPEVWPDDRPRLLLLAGVTAALAAWTKNEGLLFLLAVALSHGVVTVRARGWRAGLGDARAFVIGLAPVFVLIVCYKLWLAPPNDLMADHGVRQTAARLLDGTRYVQVLTGFADAFLEIGARGLVGVLLLAYWLTAGPATGGSARLGAKTAAVVVLLTLAGYAVVLLTAQAPLLATNIRSINRLLLQVWPSTLFAYFLGVRTAEEAGALGQRLRPGTSGAAAIGSFPPPLGSGS